jgi:hypothetical protein
MFEYFYHETIRRTIISFGTLFNDVQIQRTDSSGDVFDILKVPIAYGPTQKFLARLQESPEDLNNPFQITLPRMSFEFVGLNYDVSRKLTTTQSFISKTTSGTVSRTYMPVPYTMSFELSIMTKTNDDMLQIVEQIVPYFQPSYNLTVNLVDTIGEKRDVPITLEGISMNDDYEGDFSKRRSLIYTLRFNAKTYLFGPVDTKASKDIISKVTVGYVAGNAGSTNRDINYSATPKAHQSYEKTIIAHLSDNIAISDGIIEVDDATSISSGQSIVIGNETIYIKKVSGNKLTVDRGYYSTSISNHVSGSEIYLITSADNDDIQIGDNFGFDSNW